MNILFVFGKFPEIGVWSRLAKLLVCSAAVFFVSIDLAKPLPASSHAAQIQQRGLCVSSEKTL